jgi:signal transduction histidine kinase
MRAEEEAANHEADMTEGIGKSAAGVESGIEIPHNPVHLEGDILSNHRPATDYVRAVTHDLHTPLNVIIGMCQLLERDPERPLTPSQQDAVGRIDRNAHALLKTINDVLGHLRSER